MLCFTYSRVMPDFIEFLFSFGYQSYAERALFSSFRQRTCLSDSRQAAHIPELAWSGSEIQVCYNLKSPERSESGPSDWSIRQCSVHHTMDVKNVRANWIIIKGSELTKDRIGEVTGAGGPADKSSFQTRDKAFAASLAAHLVFCNWAAEGWWSYVDSVEDRVQVSRTFVAPVTLPPNLMTTKEEFQMRHRTETQRTNESNVARLSRVQIALREMFSIRKSNPVSPLSPVQQSHSSLANGKSQPLPPHIVIKSTPSQGPVSRQQTFESMEEQDFSFAKLQKIHHLEGRTHETILILKSNISIIRQLCHYYVTITKSESFNPASQCQDDLDHFSFRVTDNVNDMQMHIMRLENLSRLLGDRKTLVSKFINYSFS